MKILHKEIENCNDCPYSRFYYQDDYYFCEKVYREDHNINNIILDIKGKIPEFCNLENKK